MKTLKELFEKLVNPVVKRHAYFITKTYMDAGYECWIIGGSTRDLLLGNKLKDIDFAINCPLDKTKSLFDHVIATGEDHGTLTIHIDGENYEVTRFRHDVDTDGRRATIKFADTLEEDVARRDLTINAIAFNAVTGEVRDSVGGVEDLNNRVLRFIGNTKDRVLEDHLRFIRVLRFKAKLGFKLEDSVVEDARSVFDVTKLSVERIYDELNKIFGFKLSAETSKFLADALHDKMDFDFITHDRKKSNKILQDMFQLKSLFPIVAANGWKPELRLGTEFKKLLAVFEKARAFKEFQRKDLKTVLNAAGGDVEMTSAVLKYHQYYEGSDSDRNISTLSDIMDKKEPISIKDLKITGNDLMNLGYKGVEIGNMLKECLDMVYEYPENNSFEYLVEYATVNKRVFFWNTGAS